MIEKSLPVLRGDVVHLKNGERVKILRIETLRSAAGQVFLGQLLRGDGKPLEAQRLFRAVDVRGGGLA